MGVPSRRLLLGTVLQLFGSSFHELLRRFEGSHTSRDKEKASSEEEACSGWESVKRWRLLFRAACEFAMQTRFTIRRLSRFLEFAKANSILRLRVLILLDTKKRTLRRRCVSLVGREDGRWSDLSTLHRLVRLLTQSLVLGLRVRLLGLKEENTLE